MNEKKLIKIIKESVRKVLNDKSIGEVHNFNNVITNNNLNESSMNRMLQWLKDCDCAFISAFRGELKDIRDKKSTYLGPNKEDPGLRLSSSV